MKLKSRKFDMGVCLACGKPLTGLTPMDGETMTPNAGALMICGHCSYIQMWDGAKLVELPPEVMKEIEDDPACAPELQVALAMTKAFRQAGVTPQTAGEVKVIVLENLPPEICEECGKLEELRPYGLKKASGVRKWVCMDCAQKNPEEMSKAWDERMEGTNPV